MDKKVQIALWEDHCVEVTAPTPTRPHQLPFFFQFLAISLQTICYLSQNWECLTLWHKTQLLFGQGSYWSTMILSSSLMTLSNEYRIDANWCVILSTEMISLMLVCTESSSFPTLCTHGPFRESFLVSCGWFASSCFYPFSLAIITGRKWKLYTYARLVPFS